MSEIAIAKQHKSIETSLSSFLLSFAFSFSFYFFLRMYFFYFDHSLLLSLSLNHYWRISLLLLLNLPPKYLTNSRKFYANIKVLLDNYDVIEKELFTSHLKPLIHCIAFWDVCMCCVFVRGIIHASVTYIYTKAIHYNSFRFKRSLWTVEFNFQFFFSTFFLNKILQKIKYKCRWWNENNN